MKKVISAFCAAATLLAAPSAAKAAIGDSTGPVQERTISPAERMKRGFDKLQDTINGASRLDMCTEKLRNGGIKGLEALKSCVAGEDVAPEASGEPSAIPLSTNECEKKLRDGGISGLQALDGCTGDGSQRPSSPPSSIWRFFLTFPRR